MIKGLESLKIKLKKLPEAAEKAVREAMAQGANEIVAMMKALVPVESGELRDSIGWTWGKAPKYSQKIATIASDDGRLTITIYAGNSRVRYAHLVEFGAKPHAIEPKNAMVLGKDGRFGVHVDHPGAKAQPFFYVSWRANKRRAKSRITRAINKSAKQVAASSRAA